MTPSGVREASSQRTAAALICSKSMPQLAAAGRLVSSLNAQEPVVAVAMVYGDRLMPSLLADEHTTDQRPPHGRASCLRTTQSPSAHAPPFQAVLPKYAQHHEATRASAAPG